MTQIGGGTENACHDQSKTTTVSKKDKTLIDKIGDAWDDFTNGDWLDNFCIRY